MKRGNAEIQQELLRIKGSKEMLKPGEVVDWARDHPSSALHKCFQWDDGEAARQYRVWQARSIISLNIITETGERKSISLSIDRASGGGYRDIDAVARDPEKREIMLSDAMSELRRVKAKYESLKELAAVFREVDRVEQKVIKRPSRRTTGDETAHAAT